MPVFGSYRLTTISYLDQKIFLTPTSRCNERCVHIKHKCKMPVMFFLSNTMNSILLHLNWLSNYKTKLIFQWNHVTWCSKLNKSILSNATNDLLYFMKFPLKPPQESSVHYCTDCHINLHFDSNIIHSRLMTHIQGDMETLNVKNKVLYFRFIHIIPM